MASQLRRLSYVSRSATSNDNAVPTELASIVIQSRCYNHEHEIKGFLTYREGTYFQALEGPGHEVERLFKKIAQDPRHEQIRVVWDETNIDSRIFSGWKLKLSSSSVTCEEVNRFLRLNQGRYDELDDELKNTLRSLFQIDLIFSSEQGQLPPKDAFPDFEFRLQALPSLFSLSGQHAHAVEIFTFLLDDWTTASELSGRFDISIDNLHSLVSSPCVKPLLLTRRSATPDDVDENARPRRRLSSESSSGGIYHSIRAFLLASVR